MVQNAPTSTSRQSWLAVGSIALATFIAVTTEFLPIGLLTQIADDLAVSDGTAGWLITVPALSAILAVPLFLIAAGRVDRKVIVLGLTTLVIVSNLIALVAPAFAVLLAARVVLGVAVGALWSVAPSLAVRLVAERDVPRATAVVLTGISLGTVLGLPAGTLLGDALGWRAAFAASGGVAALVLLSHLWLIPSLPAGRALQASDFGEVARRPFVQLALALTILFIAGQFMAYTYVEPFLKEEAGASAATVSLILLGYGVAGLVFNALASSWAPRKPLATAIASGVLVIAGVGLLPLVGTSVPVAAVLLVVWGAGFGIFPMLANLRVFAAAPDRLEIVGGLLVIAFQVSIAGGSFGGGLLTDASGAGAALTVGAVFAVASLALLLVTRNVAPLLPPGMVAGGESPLEAEARELVAEEAERPLVASR